MANILFLDDSGERWKRVARFAIGKHVVTFVATAELAIKALRDASGNTAFDLVFLDHDLGEGDEGQAGSPENSGMTVARWMADDANKVEGTPLVVVHSLNGPRARAMVDALWERYVTIAMPFTAIDETYFEGLVAYATQLGN